MHKLWNWSGMTNCWPDEPGASNLSKLQHTRKLLNTARKGYFHTWSSGEREYYGFVKDCEHNTAPRMFRTRKHFLTCGSSGANASQLVSFCCLTKNSHTTGTFHVSHVHGLTAFLFHFLTALHLCSIFGTGEQTAIRNMAFSLAVLPNRAPFQVMSPTIPSRLAVRRLRLCWFDSQLWRGHRYFHRKWMKDKIWECWLHRCSHRREEIAAPSRIYHSDRKF